MVQLTIEYYSFGVSAIVLFALLVAGVNIGSCLIAAGATGTYFYLGNLNAAGSMVLLQVLEVSRSFSLMVIPLFLMMGIVATRAGLTAALFRAFNAWFGQLPGGIAVATTGACAGMSAITGSSVAVAGTMARIAYPELKRYGYSDRLSLGCIAVGGTLAIMIPPSITFVLFAIFAEQSIGKLLAAGLIPGFILAALYSLLIIVRCSIKPELGPRGEKTTREQKLKSVVEVVPFLTIVVAVMGGMIMGIWTPVEAAGIGTLFVIIYGFITKSVGIKTLATSAIDAALSSAAIFLVVVGSLIYGNFLALIGVTTDLSNYITSLDVSPVVIFAMIMALYFVLGWFMEITSILALTIPLMMPVVLKIGWNPIWFGVVVVVMMELAAVTPPVGLNLYAVKSAVPGVSLKEIYMGTAPFWFVNFFMVALLYAFPKIALMIPSLM